MKVLIDLTSLADNFSGIERFAMSITLELLKQKDMDFVLVFKNEIHKAFLEQKNNVECVVLKGKNKLWFNQVTLPLGIHKISADRYLFLAFPAPFFFFKKGTISAIHDVSCWDCPGSNKKHMIAYFKVLYRKVAFGKKPIITVSEFSKKRIMEVLSVAENRIHVIYNGLSESLFTEKGQQNLGFVQSGMEQENLNDLEDKADLMPGRKSEIDQKYDLPKAYLLCLSTLEPRKNLPLLIRAYQELFLEKNMPAELVLAGRKGWMVDKLLEEVEETVRGHIHFTGFIEDEDLPYVYQNAKVFVFPSIYEGFGIPPIEAMSMGTMVISSDAASMPEVLGDAAIYFESNQLEGLKQAICQALSLEEGWRNELIEKGKIQAGRYTWSESAKKLSKMLQSR